MTWIAFVAVLKKHWRKIAVGLAILVLAILIMFAYRGCTRPTAKIDLEGVQAVNSKNQAERLQALDKTIRINADVVKTVDERNTITDLDITEREKAIQAKIKEVDRKVQEAKSQGGDVTSEQLECMLVPENCQ